jgi:20S proteasome alpha/beta subunit
MTTIVYKDGIIAFDSRVVSGDEILDDDFNKLKIVQGVVFVTCGTVPDDENFIHCFFGKEEHAKGNLNGGLIYDTDGALWLASIDEETGFWKHVIEKNKHYAIGSGSSYALAAMDMGASAIDAIKAAIKRDSKSGGKVRTYKVKV